VDVSRPAVPGVLDRARVLATDKDPQRAGQFLLSASFAPH
jgi:hypothetical protein